MLSIFARGAVIRIGILSTAICGCVAFSVAALAEASDQAPIGTTTAATLIAIGTPPARPERILEVGTDIVANEQLTTSETGRAQLIFRDGSTLTVGPNAALVLDRYVYDPTTGVGEAAVSATKGLFRFVGGRISKKHPVTFRTPSATLGIRGGIIQIAIDPSAGTVSATHIFGDNTTIDMPAPGGGMTRHVIDRQEFQATVAPTGTITFQRVTADMFSVSNPFFEPLPGQSAVSAPAAGQRQRTAAPGVPDFGSSGADPSLIERVTAGINVPTPFDSISVNGTLPIVLSLGQPGLGQPGPPRAGLGQPE